MAYDVFKQKLAIDTDRPDGLQIGSTAKEKASGKMDRQSHLTRVKNTYKGRHERGDVDDVEGDLMKWFQNEEVAELAIPKLTVMVKQVNKMFGQDFGEDSANKALNQAMLEVAGLSEGLKDDASSDWYLARPLDFKITKTDGTVIEGTLEPDPDDADAQDPDALKEHLELKAEKKECAAGDELEVEVDFRNMDEVKLTVEPADAFDIEPDRFELEGGTTKLTAKKPGTATLKAEGTTDGQTKAEDSLELTVGEPTIELKADEKECDVGGDLQVELSFAGFDEVKLTLEPANSFEMEKDTFSEPGPVPLKGKSDGKALLKASGTPSAGGGEKHAELELKCNGPALKIIDFGLIPPGM